MILNQAIMMISQAIMMIIHQSVTFRFRIKKIWFCRFETWFSRIWYRYWYWFRNFSIFFKGIGISIEKIWYRKKYRIRYGKKFGIEKSIGFGIGKSWYRKSIGFGIGKYLVSKKVSDSVSEIFGIGKKLGWVWTNIS